MIDLGTPTNIPYWYSGNRQGSMATNLPPQAIPKNLKTTKWKEATMDALENIGLKQIKGNLKFQDFYRMLEGKVSFSELSDVIPQLKHVEGKLNDLNIPTNIKHYDLIGIIINAMVGEYITAGDKFMVTNNDEFAENEYERQKSDLLSKYISEQFNKELNLKLIERGINPNPEQVDIEDPEQLQQYIQQIQNMKEEMTPQQIEEYMRTKYKNAATIWAETTLEVDRERLRMDELDRQNLIDFLLTGRCFRHHIIGDKSYSLERWSPLNTFYSRDLDTKYPQDGEYIGRVHFFTPAQVIDRWGYLLSEKDKKKLLKSEKYGRGGSKWSYDSLSEKELKDKNFGETHIVPHKQYYDYEFLKGIQEDTGIPLGKKTVLTEDGEERTFNSFLPDYFPNGGGNTSNEIITALKSDPDIREDLIRVTEGYWVSYNRVGYLNYTSPTGLRVSEIVTEDLLPDFIRENDIKTYTTKTLKDVEENPEDFENSIVWDYIPATYKGVKISWSDNTTEHDLYLDIDENPYQLMGQTGNIFDTVLPVSGIIDSGVAKKVEPFQVAHNIAMNRAYNLMEKEIGMFYVFDINFLPSEYKGWGNTMDSLLELRNIIKDVGLFPVDSSMQNLKDGATFNQFGVQNLSFAPQIKENLDIADAYRYKAFEQVGFTPQRLGAPIQYTTAEGVKASQSAAYSQTEIYYEKFSDFKRRDLEMHLDVARYCKANDKDVTIYHTQSDLSNSFLRFTDDTFSMKLLNIRPQSNSKLRKDMEVFKSYLLSTNTMGSDEYDIARLITSDTMAELIEAARSARLERQAMENNRHQNTMKELEYQKQLEEQSKESEWNRAEISNERDRENKLRIEEIEAIGRAADNNGSNEDLNLITKRAELAIKAQKAETDAQIKYEELESRKEERRNNGEDKLRKFNLELEKLKTRKEEMDAKKFIALVNKN